MLSNIKPLCPQCVLVISKLLYALFECLRCNTVYVDALSTCFLNSLISETILIVLLSCNAVCEMPLNIKPLCPHCVLVISKLLYALFECLRCNTVYVDALSTCFLNSLISETILIVLLSCNALCELLSTLNLLVAIM